MPIADGVRAFSNYPNSLTAWEARLPRGSPRILADRCAGFGGGSASGNSTTRKFGVLGHHLSGKPTSRDLRPPESGIYKRPFVKFGSIFRAVNS